MGVVVGVTKHHSSFSGDDSVIEPINVMYLIDNSLVPLSL